MSLCAFFGGEGDGVRGFNILGVSEFEGLRKLRMSSREEGIAGVLVSSWRTQIVRFVISSPNMYGIRKPVSPGQQSHRVLQGPAQ